jgi:hypothetical protein
MTVVVVIDLEVSAVGIDRVIVVAAIGLAVAVVVREDMLHLHLWLIHPDMFEWLVSLVGVVVQY